MRTVFLLILLLGLLGVCAGIIFLQIYLSKKENKFAGLILPLFTFLISLAAALGMISFYGPVGSITSEFIDGEWVVIEQTLSNGREMIPGAISGVIYTFTLMNIPTVISLAIYFACRGKRNRQRSLEKMSIQDL